MTNKIKIFTFILFGFILILTSNCKKEDETNISTTVSDIDGNVYNTIAIGDYIWMSEDLKVTHYRNGDPITNMPEWTNHTSGAYLDYSRTPGSSTKNDKLYNWYAVNDNRNLAPAGWHVPSLAEWITVITYLGGENVAGGKLKEEGTIHWEDPNTGATNESGFLALPFSEGDFGGWWSISGDVYDTTRAFSLTLSNISSWTYFRNDDKEYTFFVRCIKDYLIHSR
jgi:uncharacterized protein (TIGR02145 family)